MANAVILTLILFYLTATNYRDNITITCSGAHSFSHKLSPEGRIQIPNVNEIGSLLHPTQCDITYGSSKPLFRLSLYRQHQQKRRELCWFTDNSARQCESTEGRVSSSLMIGVIETRPTAAFELFVSLNDYPVWTTASTNLPESLFPPSTAIRYARHRMDDDERSIEAQKQRLTNQLREKRKRTATPQTTHNSIYVIIPTVARPNGVDYLPSVVASWCDQIADVNALAQKQQSELIRQPMWKSMQPHLHTWHLLVFNMDPRNKALAADSLVPEKCRQFVTIESRDNQLRPGEGRTLKQARDVLIMLNDTYERYKSSMKYLFLAEDDFKLCGLSLVKIEEAIARAPKSFSELYFSFGLNGLLLQSSDIPEIIEYIKMRYPSGKQVDHILQEWNLKETPRARDYLKDRQIFTYASNLFDHLGRVSSLGHHHGNGFGCGVPLLNHFPGIAYSPELCPHDIMSPCVPLKPRIIGIHPQQV